jgi:hypothetical protein
VDFSKAIMPARNVKSKDCFRRVRRRSDVRPPASDIVSCMANEEYVAWLKNGVEGWNEWRLKNTAAYVDLTRADLRKTDLRGAHLENVDLGTADLCFADLTDSTLWEADLRGAQLEGAILRGAGLSEARLRGADLAGADLGETILASADFLSVNLRGANLEDALLHLTVFGDTDLTDAKGLDSCRHEGPSIVGIDTIFRSGGTIPERFLRGCGVPEQFITYARPEQPQ